MSSAPHVGLGMYLQASVAGGGGDGCNHSKEVDGKRALASAVSAFTSRDGRDVESFSGRTLQRRTSSVASSERPRMICGSLESAVLAVAAQASAKGGCVVAIAIATRIVTRAKLVLDAMRSTLFSAVAPRRWGRHAHWEPYHT